ncbi:MAG: penicillin-binding protein activator [Proteobacteria bacterium]|nr:penicillin-binding protein activator [Pseudomonadota bacterium]
MLRSRSTVPSLFIAAGLALAVASCAPTTGPGAARTTAPLASQTSPVPPAGRVDPNRPVLVALLAPLTAADPGAAKAGNALVNAARMAMVDLADPTMELRIYDTAGTPQGARAMAQKAVGEGAALILGPLFGANTGGVGDAAGAAGINAISFSTDSAVAGGPVFLSGFLPEAEAERIVGFAASRGLDRIAVFYPQTDYGAAALRGADQAVLSGSARVVVASGYPRTFQGIQNASGSFAGAALAAGATAILLPDSGQGLRSVGAFLDYGGLDPVEVRYLGLGQWNASATLQEPALRGGWFPAPDPDRLDLFAGLYSARYGAPPPFIAVLGYDAVQVAGQLLADARRDGSTTPFGRAELTRIEGFQGVLGPLRFEPGGLNVRAMAILEVGVRGFEVLDPAPSRLGLGS